MLSVRELGSSRVGGLRSAATLSLAAALIVGCGGGETSGSGGSGGSGDGGHGSTSVTASSTTSTASEGTGGAGGSTPGVGGSGGEEPGTGGAGTGGSSTGGAGGGTALTIAPKVVPLSASGPDALFGVAFDPAGAFYGVGSLADSTDAAADHAVFVAKFKADGTLDTTFGDTGVARLNIAEGGKNGESARGITIQSSGKIVISATVEHDVGATGTAAADRDIAIARFNADGTLDQSFGKDGIARIDLNSGIEVQGSNGATWSAADSQWSISVRPDDRLIIHCNQRALGEKKDGTGPRTDNDWVVLQLTKDGAVDETFGTKGKFVLDIEEVNGHARGGLLLPDGSFIGSGYAKIPTLNSTQAVLYKLTPAGKLDGGFGVGGVFLQTVLASITEAYAVAPQGANFVTAGYGKEKDDDSIDMVSLRVSVAGKLDPTYGTQGAVKLDVASDADRSRTLVVLPDERVLLLGGGTKLAGEIDAMVALLTPDGALDKSLGGIGYQLFDFGGPADHFWAGALSPDGKSVVIVGLKGAGTEGLGPSKNDDAVVAVIPLAQ